MLKDTMQVKIGDFGLACLDDISKKSTSSPPSADSVGRKKAATIGNGETSTADNNNNGSPPSVPSSPITISASPTGSLIGTRLFLFGRSAAGNAAQQLLMRESEHTKGVGTSLYASPEQLSGKRYDSKVNERHFFD